MHPKEFAHQGSVHLSYLSCLWLGQHPLLNLEECHLLNWVCLKIWYPQNPMEYDHSSTFELRNSKANPTFSDTALFQAKALNNETDNASILLRLEVAVAAVHGFVQKWHGGTPKNNERHLVNRGSLAQEHLSCRAFPAFPDLSVRL